MPTPTRSGYTFAGWFTAVSGGTQISSSTVINSNVTYYAHWNVIAPTISIGANVSISKTHRPPAGIGGYTSGVSGTARYITVSGIPAGATFTGNTSSTNKGRSVYFATATGGDYTDDPGELTSADNGVAKITYLNTSINETVTIYWFLDDVNVGSSQIAYNLSTFG